MSMDRKNNSVRSNTTTTSGGTSTAFKFTVLLVLFGVVIFIYYTYQTLAGTTANITLTTVPDLERGLIGHWTFDGKDIDSGASTAEVLDRSGNGVTGDMIGF
jgi:hypothetical protein